MSELQGELQSEDAAGADAPAPPAEPPTTRARRRAHAWSWLAGGSTVRPWNAEVLGFALLGLGVGACGSLAATAFVPQPFTALLAALVLWAGLAAPFVVALRRSRPRGLLRLRPADLVYALALGLALRVASGALTGAEGFPPAVDLGGSWWFFGFVAPVLVTPLVEEAFFRGVVLVTVFTLVRRRTDAVTGGIVALLVSTGLFVLAHALGGLQSPGEALSTMAVGLVCGVLVLSTARLWPAVLTHLVYNGTGVALTVVSSVLGGAGAALS